MGSLDRFFQSFIEAYNQKNHIHFLLGKRSIIICFDTEKGKNYIILQNSTASGAAGELHEENHEIVKIKGSYDIAAEILLGKRKLREAQTGCLLSISATLRTTLLLESILYLTNRPEHKLEKTN